MALKVESYSTHDNEIEKILFEVSPSNNKVINFVFRQMRQGASLSFLRFVARYLVKNVANDEAKVLLNKYIVVLVYNFLKHKKYLPDELKCEHLEDCLNGGITIEKLQEEYTSTNPFITLFNGHVSTYRKTIRVITDMLREYNQDTSFRPVNTVLFVLYNFYDYFQIETSFVEYEDSRRSCDVLIAEALAYKKEREFDFKIIDHDEFLKNIMQYQINDLGEKIPSSKDFETKVLPQRIKNAELIIGHLINDAFTTNRKVDSVKTITSSELKCYTLNPGASYASKGINKETFIFFLDYLNDGYYLNLDKVIDFKFTYNNMNYILTKQGITKL